MDIKTLFEEFKNIKIEDITRKTWYESVKFMNINKKFSVYLKKIKSNPLRQNFGSVLLGFYSKEDTDFVIDIDNIKINQKIFKKTLTYPICNIIFTKLGIYTNIHVYSDKEIYGIFVTLTEKELKVMDGYTYFSNYFYNNKQYHIYYDFGKIFINEGLYKKRFIKNLEIPRFINENIVWKNILQNTPNFFDILKFNNIIIKLTLDRHIWNKIKDNTESCKEVKKIIEEYEEIFVIYKLYDSKISDYII